MFEKTRNILRATLKWLQPRAPQAARPPAGEARPAADSAASSKIGHLRPAGGPRTGNFLYLPLQTLLPVLPPELRTRLRQPGPQTDIPIGCDTIKSQLARGLVKVQFGELRRAAQDLFAAENNWDQIWITLPLAEVIARIDPAWITCQRARGRMNIPEDVPCPFGTAGELAANTLTTPAAGQAPLPTPSAPPAAPAPSSPAPPRPEEPAKTSPSPGWPVASPAVAAESLPLHRQPIIFRRNILPNGGLGSQRTPVKPVQDTPAPQPRLVPALPVSSLSPPDLPVSPLNPPTLPVSPLSPPTLLISTPAPVAGGVSAPVAVQTPALRISLAALSQSWPPNIRQEITADGRAEATLAIPLDQAERGLKRGGLAFNWKAVRTWIEPPLSTPSSAPEATSLVLPLSVVAPAFLAAYRQPVKRQKYAVDQSIPNLFGLPSLTHPATAAGAGPTPAMAAAATAVTTVATVAPEPAKVATAAAPVAPEPEPDSRLTPEQLVRQATELGGVAGALVALADGLRVANRLSPDLNPDAVAAFVPQIYHRVGESIQKFHTGELTRLRFNIGAVPWEIVQVGNAFFTAYGRAGEPFPEEMLESLATQLTPTN